MKFKTLTLLLLAAAPFSSIALERAELLPPGMPYLRVSNVGEFGNKLKASSVGRLWADDRFQDFLGNPEKDFIFDLMFESASSEEIKELLADQTRMKTGELVVGVDTKTEGEYMIAWMTEEDFRRDQAIDQQIIALEKEPFQILKSSFQGVELVEHISNPGTPKAKSSWQTHLGATFVMSDSKEWIEQCVVRLKNDPATEPEGNPVLNLNLPAGKFILDLITDGETPDEDRRIFEGLGLLGIDNLTCRVELLDDRMLIDNTLAIGELDRGVFSILDTAPSELPTVTFIPENIASIEVGRFDLLGFWREIPTFMTTATPEAKGQFDMMLGMVQQQTGIDLEQDLLAHLGTKYLSFSTVEGDVANSILALELKDGVAFKTGVESALSAPAMAPLVANAIEIADFLDHQIYTLKNAPEEEVMAVALTTDHLLYGEPAAVRQVIRAVTSENAANNAFERSELVKELRQIVPPSAFGFGAIDWKKNMAAVMAEFSKPEIAGMLSERLGQTDAPRLDFDKLPPADHVASFFNVSQTYVEATDQGLHQKIILKY